MTKTAGSDGITDGVGLVAIERHVKTQVMELHSVAALLREFAQAHDKYAHDYTTKLPLVVLPPLSSLSRCPQLQRVTQQLETILTSASQAHTALAKELSASVVAPLEAFEKQQRHQTKQLLIEIDEALQSEKRVHESLRRLLDKRDVGTLDNNQDTENLGPEDVVSDATTAMATRDRAREIVRQRLAELALTDAQQSAILQGQLTRCFDAMTRHARRVLADTAALLASLALSTASQRMDGAATYFPCKDTALHCASLHIEVTSWMIAVFTQLIPIEEGMVKRLDALLKSHPLATVHTVFAPSSNANTETLVLPEGTTLWDLIQSHKQLTANLADPIARTLRFSRQKQETIRKELSESMDEIQRLAQTARAKVKDKEAKLLQVLQQEQSQDEPPLPVLLGSTGTEKVVSPFNLRSAMVAWTRQLSSGSPKKPLLFKSKSVSSVGIYLTPLTPPLSPSPTHNASMVKSPRRANVENDLGDARVQVDTLEKKELVQKEEMAKTLESTAFVGVKTMELMVSDYLKNVAKAMTVAATATTKCTERLTVDATKKKNQNRFQAIRLFDDGNFSDVELAKRLEDGKDLGPEAKTETDRAVGTEPVESKSPPVKPLAVVRSPVLCAVPTEEEIKNRLSAVVNELSKLPIRETVEQILCLTQKLLRFAWQALGHFAQSVQRSPDQWQCLAAVVVLVGLLSVVRRFDRLDHGWDEVAELQRENARRLQQLVDLLGE